MRNTWSSYSGTPLTRKTNISFPEIFISQVQIGLLCDCDAGVTEDAAEGINVHSVHQAALCEIVSEAMGRNAFIQTDASQIALEVRLKVTDLYVVSCVTSGGEEIIGL